MGRNRKSESEKAREGNRGKKKLGKDPLVETITDITPPADMGEDEIVYWNRYSSYMIRNGLLTELNVSDLESLCYLEAQRVAIRKMLRAEAPSLLQEKKNYHGDVVDLVEGVYSKLLRTREVTIRTLKADLRIRTDKVPVRNNPECDDEFSGLLGGRRK
jgi:hypothetical protein